MNRKYPWEEWFAEDVFTLVRGLHYDCSQSTMTQTVRNNASARGLRVRLVDTGIGIIVKVTRRGRNATAHTDKTPVAT